MNKKGITRRNFLRLSAIIGVGAFSMPKLVAQSIIKFNILHCFAVGVLQRNSPQTYGSHGRSPCCCDDRHGLYLI